MGIRRQYMKLRGQRWWFQLAVPQDCRVALGRANIYANLHTSDQAVAQAKALELAGHWRQQFALLRQTPHHPADAFAVAQAQARAEVERIARTVADPEERDLRTSLVFDWALERELDRFGYSDASELKPGDLPAHIEAALLGIKAIVQGDTTVPPEYGTPFSRTAKAYLEDRQRVGAGRRLTDQTVSQMEAVFRLYRDHSEDAPLGNATRRSAKAFFDKLKKLDANWGRSPKTKSRKLDQLLALSDRPDATPLSDRTLFRYMIALDQVWNWAKDGGEVDGDSPFSGQVKKGGNDTAANAPWSDDALVAYFAAHPDRSKKGKPDPFHWLPRVACLSGMRLAEICALTVEDIRKAEGVTYFDISKGKTSAAIRAIPVHSDLSPLLEQAPKSGNLFPDLLPGGPDKKLSWHIGKRLGRRFKEIPGGSTFHAFRKNVAQTFERERVPETEAAQILGHGRKGITYGIYSPHGIHIAQRRDLIELLRLPKGVPTARSAES